MNKKERRDIINTSLLDNPNMETQAKDKPYKVALRVALIVLLFSLLFVSYVFNFSTMLYPSWLGKCFTANFDASAFYNANSCDIIVIKPYDDINDANIGDIVVYSTNIGDGSGRLVSVHGEEVDIELASGEIKGFKQSLIVGRQERTIAVVGFFWAIIDSYYGVFALSLVILVYVAYVTFSRINYENTEHGKKLYKRFRYKQREERERKRLLAQVKDIEGIDLKTAQMLQGNYEENKKKFLEFDYETKGKLKEKYKYILAKIHDAYLAKKDLTREEKRQITAITELMFVANEFDLDMEYMLIDLSLKTHLHDFDTEIFKTCAIEFMNECKHKSDLLNFASVLYILVYKNAKIRDENIQQVAVELREKLEERSAERQDMQNNLPKAILKLIKI